MSALKQSMAFEIDFPYSQMQVQGRDIVTLREVQAFFEVKVSRGLKTTLPYAAVVWDACTVAFCGSSNVSRERERTVALTFRSALTTLFPNPYRQQSPLLSPIA